MKIISNILENWFVKLPYIVKHVVVVWKLQLKYLHWIRYPFHDLDKLLMTMFLPFLNRKTISKIHREHCPHHIEYYDPTYPSHREKYMNGYSARWTKFLNHLDEAIIDWESARYTKSDKPLDAWDTCLRWYPQIRQYVRYEIEKLKIPYNHKHHYYDFNDKSFK